MSSSSSAILKPTAERRAIRVGGSALALLSFQTLGTTFLPNALKALPVKPTRFDHQTVTIRWTDK